MPRVSGVRGAVTTTKSDCASSSWSRSRVKTSSTFGVGWGVRRIPITRMWNAFSLSARSWPEYPRPMMPQVWPVSSGWNQRSQLARPPGSSASAGCRALSISISITACSAIEIAPLPATEVRMTGLAIISG